MLRCGIARVFYLDLDAHHGDGVQDAFAQEPRVFTLSIHEAGRWPMGRDGGAGETGGIDDRAGGEARNLPVPAGLNDTELAFLMNNAVLPLIEVFGPDAIYIQGGCDALADDPQSKLELSNGALWRAVATVNNVTERLLVSGGGGYNPFTVGRCWAGIWATLNGFHIPDTLPTAAEDLLRQVRWRHRQGRQPQAHWMTTLKDSPNPGPVRDAIKEITGKALQA